MTISPPALSEAARVDAAFIGLFGSDHCACPENHAVTGACAGPGDIPVRYGESVIPLCRECAACWPR